MEFMLGMETLVIIWLVTKLNNYSKMSKVLSKETEEFLIREAELRIYGYSFKKNSAKSLYQRYKKIIEKALDRGRQRVIQRRALA